MKKYIIGFLISLTVSLLSINIALSEETKTIELFVGESLTVDSKVINGGSISDYNRLIWHTTDSEVAYMSGNILVTRKPGTCEITGYKDDGNVILQVTLDIIVKSTVKAIEFESSSIDLYVGQSEKINWTIIPVDDLDVNLNTGVSVQSTNTSIVSVDGQGNAKGLKEGIAYINVKSTENNKTSSIKVSVISTLESISINDRSIHLYVGETKSIPINYIPKTGFTEVYLKESLLSTSDSSIMSINYDKSIKGVSEGSAVLTAESIDGGKADRVNVIVSSMVDHIVLDKVEINLNDQKKSEKVSVAFYPKEGLSKVLDQRVKWISENTSVATVGSDGTVYAKGTGKTQIYCETFDGNKKAYAIVSVALSTKPIEDPTIKIEQGTLSAADYIVKVGQRIDLGLSVLPVNANRSSLRVNVFPSTSAKVINENGNYKIEFLQEGGVEVKLYDGSTHLHSIAFVSQSMVKSIDLEEDKFEKVNGINKIYLGQEFELKCDFQSLFDEEPLNQKVTYSSSDNSIVAVNGNKIKGLNVGTVTITATSQDGSKRDAIAVIVGSNVSNIVAESRAEIGVNITYVPTVIFEPVNISAYNLNEVLDKTFTLEMQNVMVNKEFVDNEILYIESELASLYTKQGSIDSEDYFRSLQLLTKRKLEYEVLADHSDGDYYKLNGLESYLTNRLGSILRVASVSGTKATGYISGKFDLVINYKDPSISKIIPVTISDSSEEILIFDRDGNLIVSSNASNTVFDTSIIYANNPSLWAVNEILEANRAGFLTEKSVDNFTDNITREEFVELIMRFYERATGDLKSDSTLSYFSDVSNSYVDWAYEMNLVKGVGNNIFNPNGYLTREEMCTMVGRLIEETSIELGRVDRELHFSDHSSISDWAIESVYSLVNGYGLVNGIGNNLMSPKSQLTKEEAIVIVNRMNNRRR